MPSERQQHDCVLNATTAKQAKQAISNALSPVSVGDEAVLKNKTRLDHRDLTDSPEPVCTKLASGAIRPI